jgi:hypothetical protein
MRLRSASAILATLASLLCCAFAASGAQAAATWSGAEQPIAAGAQFPIGLGHVGDVEFWAPNRGLLITAGNPPSIAAGIWAYNGVEWHELSSVCGAGDGRIAWAAGNEFWTISDGRAGQASESGGSLERAPPLEDNTLCHFANGQLLASYAHPAFQADSYQAMHGAACFDPSDCWFAGDPLEEPQVGAFQLRWNGASLEAEPYAGEGHAVEDMRAFEGRLYESVRIAHGDRVANSEQTELPAIHKINPAGVQPAFQAERDLPLYAEGELPEALDFLHLSAAGAALWGAAGPKRAEAGGAGQVTLVRRVAGVWTQLIGPEHSLAPIFPENPLEEQALLGGEAKNATVSAIGVEPGGGGAWLALRAPEGTAAQVRAVLLHVSNEGEIGEVQTLPSAAEQQGGVGPKGAATTISCPAAHDCWLATSQGWLFHLAPEGQRSIERDTRESEYFTGLISFRPRDLGLPQVPPDAPPPDDSGLVEATPALGGAFAESAAASQAKVRLPLLSHLHSRLVHGTTLELRFHLAVKARVRLVAKRKQRVVATTATHTFAAGNRKLMLAFNVKRWPTKLDLQSHALAALPLVSSVTGEGALTTTETTGFAVLPHALLQSGLGSPP